LSRNSPITKERRVDETSGEEYIAFKITSWQRLLPSTDKDRTGEKPGFDTIEGSFRQEREIVLVPYYFRANRRDKGQIRVGLPTRHQ
jgi:hypothetical protein